MAQQTTGIFPYNAYHTIPELPEISLGPVNTIFMVPARQQKVAI